MFILGIAIDFTLAKLDKGKNRTYFGYRVNHTFPALIILIVGFFIYREALISLGLGIIISHTLRTKEFIFIKKQ